MRTLFTRNTLIVLGCIAVLFAAVLHMLGRISICECGFHLWTNNSFASDTSQNFGDPYSYSHILHGLIFFWFLFFTCKKIPLHWRFVIAIAIEIAWEILENTPLIINRYRAATASLDYFGDSILNSFGDVFFTALGFYLASRLPWWMTAILFAAVELLMLYFLRDNLTLNVLMLLYPIGAIKEWQMAS